MKWTRMALLGCCVALLAACAPAPRPTTKQTTKEVSLDLNKQTVSSVKPDKATSGYGLQIMLSDYGWNQVQRLLVSRPDVIVLLVNGAVLTREVAVGGSFPREFFWVPSLGENELSKDQADALTKQILGK